MNYFRFRRVFSTAFLIFLLVQCSRLVAINDSEHFSEIVSAISRNEDSVGYHRFQQTELLHDRLKTGESVQRKFHYEEFGASYRIHVDYPNVPYPPAGISGSGREAGTPPWITYEYLYDSGNSIKAFFPQAKRGLIVQPDSRDGFFKTFPATNLRPMGGASNIRLSEFLLDKSTNGTASITLTQGLGSEPVLVTVRDRKYRYDIYLDEERNYSIVQLSIFDEDEKPLSMRRFLDYRKYGDSWISHAVTESRYRGENSTFRAFQIDHFESSISPDEFRLDFEYPTGTRVVDHVKGVSIEVPNDEDFIEGSIQRIREVLPVDAVEANGESNFDSQNLFAFGQDVYDGFELILPSQSSAASVRMAVFLSLFMAIVCLGLALFIRQLKFEMNKALALYLANFLFFFGLCWGGMVLVFRMADSDISPGVIIDIGTIDANGHSDVIVTLVNPGRENLVISDVQKSCSCTVVDMRDVIIAAGEKKRVVVRYEVLPGQMGVFSSTIGFVFANSDLPMALVEIRGFSEPFVRANPQTIRKSPLRTGTVAISEITFSGSRHVDLNLIESGASMGDGIYVIESVPLLSGENVGGYVIRVAIPVPEELGPWRKILSLNEPDMPYHFPKVVVSGVANDRINVVPEMIVINREIKEPLEVLFNGLSFDQIDYYVWDYDEDLVSISFKMNEIDPLSSIAEIVSRHPWKLMPPYMKIYGRRKNVVQEEVFFSVANHLAQ